MSETISVERFSYRDESKRRSLRRLSKKGILKLNCISKDRYIYSIVDSEKFLSVMKELVEAKICRTK